MSLIEFNFDLIDKFVRFFVMRFAFYITARVIHQFL